MRIIYRLLCVASLTCVTPYSFALFGLGSMGAIKRGFFGFPADDTATFPIGVKFSQTRFFNSIHILEWPSLVQEG